MGTRADFYVGRGKKAEWIGSIAWDGMPDSIPDFILKATSPENFKAAVENWLEREREDATFPKDGWPWPWEDSQTTDYAYAFDGGKVWASSFGYAWFDPTKPEPEDDEGEKVKVAEFPNMKAVQNVQLGGKKSGLLVFGVKRDSRNELNYAGTKR